MGFRSFHFKLAVSVVAKQRQVASTQTGGRFNTIMKGIKKAHQAVFSNAELVCLVCHFVCKSFIVYYMHDGWSWLIPNTLLILHLILVASVINNGFGSLVLFFNLKSLFGHGWCILAYKCVCISPNKYKPLSSFKSFH